MMDNEPTTIKQSIFPNGNEADQPIEFNIDEYIKNISEQYMLQIYNNETDPELKFVAGEVKPETKPTIEGNSMTIILPEDITEEEMREKIYKNCTQGVELVTQNNKKYIVKLYATEYKTLEEAKRDATERNVEYDTGNFHKAVLFYDKPCLIKVEGYNSKENTHKKITDESMDYSEDSTQEPDDDELDEDELDEEFQKSKYICGILYGMQNNRPEGECITNVPWFQIQKPDIKNPDSETLALFRLSVILNTCAGQNNEQKRRRYQNLYNKYIQQGEDPEEVIKFIAKLDLLNELYVPSQTQQQLMSPEILGLINYLNSKDKFPLKLPEEFLYRLENKLDDTLQSQTYQNDIEKIISIYSGFLDEIENTIFDQNEMAQINDMGNIAFNNHINNVNNLQNCNTNAYNNLQYNNNIINAQMTQNQNNIIPIYSSAPQDRYTNNNQDIITENPITTINNSILYKNNLQNPQENRIYNNQIDNDLQNNTEIVNSINNDSNENEQKIDNIIDNAKNIIGQLNTGFNNNNNSNNNPQINQQFMKNNNFYLENSQNTIYNEPNQTRDNSSSNTIKKIISDSQYERELQQINNNETSAGNKIMINNYDCSGENEAL